MRSILLVSATGTEHNETHILGHPIHIIGIGKVDAAIRTTALIERYNPDIVINFGSCGNISHFEKGTVLEVEEVVNDFQAYGITSYPILKPNTGFLPVTDKVKCFTTDTFFDASKTDYTNDYLENISDCQIVEMECYSVVKSCLHANKIVYCYKWVSDDGDSSSWEANAALGYEKFKELFKSKFI